MWYEIFLGKYVAMTPDKRGRFGLEPAAAWIGLEDRTVYFYTKDDVRVERYSDVMRTSAEAKRDETVPDKAQESE